MFVVQDALRGRGGIACTRELLADGLDPQLIRMAVDYDRVIRLRKGWFATLDTSEEVVRAFGLGGSLACHSALDFYEGRVSEGRLHVAVHRRASHTHADRPAPPGRAARRSRAAGSAVRGGRAGR
jgi:hypothetical protein